jgi:predicted  nucleic acid-binding Zn-ribbon protein
MIEVIAAIAGASISVAAMGAMGFSRKSDEARDAVIRLTSAVEHIATQLEVLHTDIKEDRRETFTRLNTVEQRVAKIEAKDMKWEGQERRKF